MWQPGQTGAGEKRCAKGSAHPGEAVTNAVPGDCERSIRAEAHGHVDEVHGAEDPGLDDGGSALVRDDQGVRNENCEGEDWGEEEPEGLSRA